jgi:hypothetical protein
MAGDTIVPWWYSSSIFTNWLQVRLPQPCLKLQNEGQNSKIKPLFVEGLWLNFWVLIDCARNFSKKGHKPKKGKFLCPWN